MRRTIANILCMAVLTLGAAFGGAPARAQSMLDMVDLNSEQFTKAEMSEVTSKQPSPP